MAALGCQIAFSSRGSIARAPSASSIFCPGLRLAAGAFPRGRSWLGAKGTVA
jgi:hypothetical protein